MLIPIIVGGVVVCIIIALIIAKSGPARSSANSRNSHNPADSPVNQGKGPTTYKRDG